MKLNLAIVGSGPTAIYCLKHIVERGQPLSVTVFEASEVAGYGMPYDPRNNSKSMLANIASIEIPPILSTLADWLKSADDKFLSDHDIERSEINERAFYPRVVIGSYFSAQLAALVDLAKTRRIDIDVRIRARVKDIIPANKTFRVVVEGQSLKRFDSVIMATGHSPKRTKARPTRLFRSPYPTRTLALSDDRSAIILGSSLSAIDAAVALAEKYGRFVGSGEAMVYEPFDQIPIRLTMASRKGLLPEADFFYPIPEEPLRIFSAAAVAKLAKGKKTGLLSRAMKLFKRQLLTDDPTFMARLGCTRFTPESFGRSYFRIRGKHRTFDAIAANLREARHNHERKNIVMWRYTLMRAHEVFATLVPFFDRKDLGRFHRHMKGVFADGYGCVPHLSIERLLALHRAGCFAITPLGSQGRVKMQGDRFAISTLGRDTLFGCLIDARGQQVMTMADLGFARLAKSMADDDSYRRTRLGSESDQYRLNLANGLCENLFCLSLPIMMKRYPFAQGLVSSDNFGRNVATSLM